MSEELLVEVENGVAVLTMNRPETLNALNHHLHECLNDALSNAAASDDVGCVVLTGAGRGFCSGGDLNSMSSRDKGTQPRKSDVETRIDMMRDHMVASKLLHEMPKPTIAMINGPCAGAGFSLAGACDFRFAGESALLTSAFVKVGMSGDSGGSWFWTQILGTAKARRVYLFSEKFDAHAALDYGMVHEVWPDNELRARTMEHAEKIANSKRAALRFAKEALNAAEDGTLEQVLELETLTMALSSFSRPPKARS